jgi:hypothetical protein
MSQEVTLKQNMTDIEALLGPPPLLTGESHEIYNTLFSQVAESLDAGGDIILKILTKKFVDSTWEASRLARHRTLSIDRRVRQSREFQVARKKKQLEKRQATIEKIAERLGQPKNEFTLMIEQEGLIEASVQDVDEILERAPTEIEHNRGVEETILLQGQYDGLMNSAARRQDDAIVLIERYQAMKRRRQTSKDIIEGDYSEIATAETPRLTMGETRDATLDQKADN